MKSIIMDSGSFSFPPTSHDLQYISVTSGFTMLSMKTKYVCRGLISLYVNFHSNRTIKSTNLHVKICRWGEMEKKPGFQMICNAFCFGGKNGFKSIFSPILLSERNMGIDYIYNFIVHKNSLYSICFLYLNCRAVLNLRINL